MLTTNRTGNVKFVSLIQIWAYIRLYNPSGNLQIFENGKMLNQFSLSHVENRKADLFTITMKQSFWYEIMKTNKIVDTFGSPFERFRIVRNKSLPLGYLKILEGENSNAEILKRAYYPEKSVLKYFLHNHEWQIPL
jgi:hypothetical protein